MQNIDISVCSDALSSLRSDFASRFCDVRSCQDFKLVTAPFDASVDDFPDNVKMELVELQCDERWKSICLSLPPFTFNSTHVLPSSNIPAIISHVKPVIAMCGSTYCCEQLFSKMKQTKSHLRSRITDVH